MTATTGFAVHRLDGHAAREAIRPLAGILRDCVDGGASVGFLAPLSAERAEAFWSKVADAVAAGERALFAARDTSGIVGTVQLVFALMENQPHRAEVSKLLVHRRVRRQGVGEALMLAAERAALDAGRTLLTLDTATAEAERLYQRFGWHRTGIIPGYALNPDATLCDTVIYWKQLA